MVGSDQDSLSSIVSHLGSPHSVTSNPIKTYVYRSPEKVKSYEMDYIDKNIAKENASIEVRHLKPVPSQLHYLDVFRRTTPIRQRTILHATQAPPRLSTM